jgi:outer membrane lipoprotein-sorting protein
MTGTTRAAALAVATLLFLTASPAALAQTADELVARNLAARGLSRWRTVQTMRLTGKVTSSGREVPVVVWRKRPNLMRQETAFPIGTVVAIFDGERAWTVNPFTGGETPREITGPPVDVAREQADFDGLLVDYRAKGHAIALDGMETIEGRRAVRLTLTKKNGHKQELLLDADTALEIATFTIVSREGRPARLETRLDDYRSVDGVMVPFRIRDFVDDVLTSELVVEKVELDVRIDAGVFKIKD